ncbi:MAG: DUF2252 domain-containing protein [Candidatus Competibacterales bacterium]
MPRPELTRELESSANWTPQGGEERRQLLGDELQRFNADLEPEVRQAKLRKLEASPFAFYRGTAHLYYRDLAHDDTVSRSNFKNPETTTWIQGDMHLQNIGAFADDDGQVVFDLNDFDEGVVSHYHYDVWRMASSIVLAAEETGNFDPVAIDGFVDTFSESYLDTLADYRGNDDEEDFQLRAKNAKGPLDEFLEEVEEDESREKMLDKWTTGGEDGRRRFRDRPGESSKLAEVSEAEAAALTAAVADYHPRLRSDLAGDEDYFAVKDVAARLDAGTGSLGTPRFYVLVEGETDRADDDVILDVKQQGWPALAPHLGAEAMADLRARYGDDPAARVVEAQRAMGTDVDDHLGTLQVFEGAFSVRERSPYKESFETQDLDDDGDFAKLAAQWGTILATAHARADRDFRAGVVTHGFEQAVDDLTDGRHAEFRAEVRSVARGYADQVMTDYRLFLGLRADGDLD